MDARTSKTLALLGGVATLALGSSFMLRFGLPKPQHSTMRCAPRLVELEGAVCEASLARPSLPLAETAPLAP